MLSRKKHLRQNSNTITRNVGSSKRTSIVGKWLVYFWNLFWYLFGVRGMNVKEDSPGVIMIFTPHCKEEYRTERVYQK